MGRKFSDLVDSDEVRPEVKYKVDHSLDLTEEEANTLTRGEFSYIVNGY